MAVTDSFRDFVLEQLEQTHRDIVSKRMFGGIGVYAGELFFALIDDDLLYFKVDDETRSAFTKRKMSPFRPYGDERETMQYYQVPVSVLEDADELKIWVKAAVAVAQRANDKKRASQRRSGSKRERT